jgi:hypothetical protein
VATSDQNCLVEVVDGWADVARENVDQIADDWKLDSNRDLDGQVLFTWLPWSPVGMTNDGSGWYAGIGRDCFVPGITGEDPLVRMADNC